MSGIWLCIQNPASTFLHNSGLSILPWEVCQEWGPQGWWLLRWEPTTSHHHLTWGENQGLQDRRGNSEVEHMMIGSYSSLHIHTLYLGWRATRHCRKLRPQTPALCCRGQGLYNSFKQVQHPDFPERTLVTNSTMAFYGGLCSALQPSWAHT
jgi:hypothetical protein